MQLSKHWNLLFNSFTQFTTCDRWLEPCNHMAYL